MSIAKGTRPLFYTKEEVEECLKHLACYMHHRLPTKFHPLLMDMNRCGFAFTSINWNKIAGSYFGVQFIFYSQEDIITGEFRHKINW